MARHSHLIYSESRVDIRQSQELMGEVLYESADGIPVLWVFAFGARNVWNPGDAVEDRGGAVGRKNPYETQVEVSLARLEHAEATMRDAPWLWPWYSAMPILRRKLMTKPASGFLRLRAPWLAQLDDDQMATWRGATAIIENCVNFIAHGRLDDASMALDQLRPFTPFVGIGGEGDREAFDAATLYRDDAQALRLALLTLGAPERRQILEAAAEKEIAPALEKLWTLGPAPKRKRAVIAKRDKENAGLLKKLAGLFSRK